MLSTAQWKGFKKSLNFVAGATSACLLDSRSSETSMEHLINNIILYYKILTQMYVRTVY